eukprot:GHVU01206392.1.p1 GENE.GHVU01206392.1~~GHVU01206392.1.p1  ORF type:complete len:1073 (+),score=66.41 GHVU01206392.1:225-3221(+)
MNEGEYLNAVPVAVNVRAWDDFCRKVEDDDDQCGRRESKVLTVISLTYLLSTMRQLLGNLRSCVTNPIIPWIAGYETSDVCKAMKRPNLDEFVDIESFKSKVQESTVFNSSQKDVITDVINSDQRVSCIQGPPGTGKTYMLAEMIWLLFLCARAGKFFKMLIVTSSNVAINLIVMALRDQGRLYTMDDYMRGIKKDDAPKIRGTRLGHPSSVQNDLLLDVMISRVGFDHLYRHLEEKRLSLNQTISDSSESLKVEKAKKEVQEVIAAQLVMDNRRIPNVESMDLVMTTCNGAGTVAIQNMNFTIKAQDEATATNESENQIAFSLAVALWYILIKDPKQLGAFASTRLTVQMRHGRSLIERLMERAVHFNVLTEQHRMTPVICKHSSDRNYEGRLTTAENVLSRTSKIPEGIRYNHFLVFDVCGYEQTGLLQGDCVNEDSKYNVIEAVTVLNIVVALVQSGGVVPSNIAVTAFYAAQLAVIKLLLQTRCAVDPQFKEVYESGVGLHTVDSFQGGQAPIVLFSTARSCSDEEVNKIIREELDRKRVIGFINDKQRVNVSLTRSEEMAILVGNVKLLRLASEWEALLNYISANNDTCRITRKFVEGQVTLDDNEQRTPPSDTIRQNLVDTTAMLHHRITMKQLRNIEAFVHDTLIRKTEGVQTSEVDVTGSVFDSSDEVYGPAELIASGNVMRSQPDVIVSIPPRVVGAQIRHLDGATVRTGVTHVQTMTGGMGQHSVSSSHNCFKGPMSIEDNRRIRYRTSLESFEGKSRYIPNIPDMTMFRDVDVINRATNKALYNINIDAMEPAHIYKIDGSEHDQVAICDCFEGELFGLHNAASSNDWCKFHRELHMRGLDACDDSRSIPSPIFQATESLTWNPEHDPRYSGLTSTLKSLSKDIVFQKGAAEVEARSFSEIKSVGDLELFIKEVQDGVAEGHDYIGMDSERHRMRNGGTFEFCCIIQIATAKRDVYIRCSSNGTLPTLRLKIRILRHVLIFKIKCTW